MVSPVDVSTLQRGDEITVVNSSDKDKPWVIHACVEYVSDTGRVHYRSHSISGDVRPGRIIQIYCKHIPVPDVLPNHVFTEKWHVDYKSFEIACVHVNDSSEGDWSPLLRNSSWRTTFHDTEQQAIQSLLNYLRKEDREAYEEDTRRRSIYLHLVERYQPVEDTPFCEELKHWSRTETAVLQDEPLPYEHSLNMRRNEFDPVQYKKHYVNCMLFEDIYKAHGISAEGRYIAARYIRDIIIASLERWAADWLQKGGAIAE